MEQVRGVAVPDTLADVADRAHLALLVYDMQVDIAGRLPGTGPVVERAGEVLAAARAAGLRVFFVRHTSLPIEVAGAGALRAGRALQRAASYADVVSAFRPGSPGHEIVPELAPRDDEAVLDKLGMSAFVGSPLEFALRDAGVGAVAIVGAVLEIGIAPTVHHAVDLGFLPIVVGDACFTFERDGHTLAALARSGPVVDTAEFCKQVTSAQEARE